MKKKGFTLVELLAVIVILAIIAVIATPLILNVIDNAKKGAAEASASGYLDAIEKGILEEELKGNIRDKNAIYVIGTSDLSFVNIKGDKPIEGWVQLEKGVAIDYSLKIGDYVVSYNLTTKKIETIKNGDIKEQPTDSDIVEEKTYVCERVQNVTTGVQANDDAPYVYGAEYNCDPGDGTVRTFFVLEDGDNTTLTNGVTGTTNAGEISLIMDRNIGETVAWDEESETSSNGPLTALSYLQSQTSNWNDVILSLPTANQVSIAGGDTSWNYNYTANILADWLTTNLDKGYWTSTVRSETGAYNVHALKDIRYNDIIDATNFGIRPVITISKSKIK